MLYTLYPETLRAKQPIKDCSDYGIITLNDCWGTGLVCTVWKVQCRTTESWTVWAEGNPGVGSGDMFLNVHEAALPAHSYPKKGCWTGQLTATNTRTRRTPPTAHWPCHPRNNTCLYLTTFRLLRMRTRTIKATQIQTNVKRIVPWAIPIFEYSNPIMWLPDLCRTPHQITCIVLSCHNVHTWVLWVQLKHRAESDFVRPIYPHLITTICVSPV